LSGSNFEVKDKKIKREHRRIERHSKSKSINLSSLTINQLMMEENNSGNAPSFDTSDESEFTQFSQNLSNMSLSPKGKVKLLRSPTFNSSERSYSGNQYPKKSKFALTSSKTIYETSPTVLESESYKKLSPLNMKKRSSSNEKKILDLESQNLNSSTVDSSFNDSYNNFELDNKENSISVTSLNNTSIDTINLTTNNPVFATCQNCNKNIPFESVNEHSCANKSSFKNFKRFSMNRNLIGQFRIQKDK
jgi:hypothetical protein